MTIFYNLNSSKVPAFYLEGYKEETSTSIENESFTLYILYTDTKKAKKLCSD